MMYHDPLLYVNHHWPSSNENDTFPALDPNYLWMETTLPFVLTYWTDVYPIFSDDSTHVPRPFFPKFYNAKLTRILIDLGATIEIVVDTMG